jgi:O-antigen/teichoic acid export membrane protein
MWSRFRERFETGFRHQLVRNAAWMFYGQGLQLLGRIGYFIIVARVLGPREYGTFVACTALVATLAPFASCGTGNVMIKYVARDREVLPAHFGNALLATVATGILLTLVVLALRSRVLPISATVPMVLAIALADLLASEITGACLYAFLALEQGARYSYLATASTAIRLIAALGLFAISPDATHWAYLYCVSGIVAAATGLVAVSCCCGVPRFEPRLLVPSVREGFHFATALASQSVYNDIDKTMLARLSTPESAAIYAVAYRFIEPAILPIRSLGAASFPEFFRRGANSVSSSFALACSILRRSAIYGIGVTMVLYMGAAFIPLVLGTKYAASTIALRWLCLLPVFKCIHIFLSDTLTGANLQSQTSAAQITVSVFNVLLNLWIVRAFAWRGAAWSSLMTDGLLIVLLSLIIGWHLRRERESALRTGPPLAALEGQQ